MLHLSVGVVRKWRSQFWIVVAMLGIATGSALGQEAQGVFTPPEVAARAAVLMNPATGEILFAKEPHLRLPPASTTKVLTALVALERLDPNTRVLVSSQAASAPPSRVGLHAGEAALTQDLLYGLLLKSGNDAAETLAEGAGGSIYGFAELMNAKAAQIGALDSHFANPHGLPNDDHYSTAYDLALIFRQAMSHPMFADIVRTRSAALRIESGNGPYDDWRMVPVQSHNRLLASYEGARGGKTGFTLKARRCFVGEVDRGGIRLIVAVLNSPNSGTLWQDARALFDYGFSRYGLAPPPPIQPEPRLIMARRTPAASDDDDDDRAIAERPTTQARISTALRAAPISTRPVVPVRNTVVAEARSSVKTPRTIAKPTLLEARKTQQVVASAKPTIGKATRLEKRESVTAGKTVISKAANKPEKRETAKVAAARPNLAGKPSQKMAKR